MHNKKIIALFLSALAYLYLAPACAAEKVIHPFYIGLTGGYGSTTWGGLVPENPNVAMSLSTPTEVTEGGFVWGVVTGYEFIPQFAVEANYMHYQAARLYFDSMSLFSFDYNGQTELTSHIESVSLMAKVMLYIPHTKIRFYSSVGPGVVHRYDSIKNIWRVTPSFGAGFNYDLTEHVMVELGTNYMAGYGKAEMNPTKDYVPFLYSAFLRIAYRF